MKKDGGLGRMSGAGLLALLTGACAFDGLYNSPNKYDTAAAVAAETEIIPDPYKKVSGLSGPLITTPAMQWRLRGWKTAGAWRYQLYVAANFSDWAFLDAAWADGKRLDFTPIARDVGYCSGSAYGGGCSVVETVGVNFTASEMQTYAQTGLDIKLSGQRGETTLYISMLQFQGVLDAAAHWDAGI